MNFISFLKLNYANPGESENYTNTQCYNHIAQQGWLSSYNGWLAMAAPVIQWGNQHNSLT